MNQSNSTWRQFEHLVHRILQANNFIVQVHSPRGDRGFDFFAKLGEENWAIEVKYYRTARAQPRLIESAAIRVINNGKAANANKGMLVVSCVIPTGLRQTLEDKYPITYVDRTDLKNWASISPELADELDVLVEVDPAESSERNVGRLQPVMDSKPLGSSIGAIVDDRGSNLCKELAVVRRGKIGWAKYEKICVQILKYLFANDLEGWHEQKRTDDGLNRFDFICRMRPATEFWKFLLDHLNSRYILFEFKNYAGLIKQGQILTTEKYLLERGLRRVAIVMTREGADKNAISMTQGAMREHGKLMLVVNDKDLCDMLHMKERGEDPTDRLFELADDFLLSLPR